MALTASDAVFVDRHAQAGQALHGIVKAGRAQAHMLAYGAAAVTAKADCQHLVIGNADQGGIKAGMHDHRHQAHFQSLIHMPDSAVYIRLLSDSIGYIFDRFA